jgi:hypothetical protein
MNKFSIFHTSFCGSTLLASLLSRSIDTYTEPSWSYQITDKTLHEEIESFILTNHLDNSLVKYSSFYCYAAPLLPHKKVFLYRKLKHHLQKSLSYSNGTIKFNRDIMILKTHPYLKHISLTGSLLQICAYLWIDRLMWMKESSDVLWIDCDDFFDDTIGTAESVCDHFGITYCQLDIPFHVKEAGFNHTDSPIRVNEIEHSNRTIINPIDTKIVNFDNNKQMSEIIKNIQESFPMIESKYIQ